MRYQVNLFVLISVVGLVSAGFTINAQGASGENAVSVPSIKVSESPAYPYDAEITGDDVYIRSGAGSSYYPCGKLNKGDKVKIVGSSGGVWSKIVPPSGSFSWISAQYVKPDTSDPTIGIVTGDDVRVYAGSDVIRPEASTYLQGKLSKNERVKLLGQELHDYYKIAVPSLPDAYLWVSTQYTKPITIQTPIVVPPAIKQTIPAKPETIGPEMTSSTADKNEIAPAAVVPAANEPAPLEKYYALQKEIEAEQTKPLNEQDYSAIKEGLQKLIDDKDAGKAARYAQAILARVNGFELAIEVGKAVNQQNKELQQSNEEIEKAYQQKISEIKNLGKYAAIGKLQNMLSLGSGTYRLVDDNDKNICIAIPSETASGKDFSSFIGKKVGLVGTIDNNQSLGAIVRFDQIVSIK